MHSKVNGSRKVRLNNINYFKTIYKENYED